MGCRGAGRAGENCLVLAEAVSSIVFGMTAPESRRGRLFAGLLRLVCGACLSTSSAGAGVVTLFLASLGDKRRLFTGVNDCSASSDSALLFDDVGDFRNS
jgi:hypothetical protein